jgi:hypothetical protein
VGQGLPSGLVSAHHLAMPGPGPILPPENLHGLPDWIPGPSSSPGGPSQGLLPVVSRTRFMVDPGVFTGIEHAHLEPASPHTPPQQTTCSASSVAYSPSVFWFHSRFMAPSSPSSTSESGKATLVARRGTQNHELRRERRLGCQTEARFERKLP